MLKIVRYNVEMQDMFISSCVLFSSGFVPKLSPGGSGRPGLLFTAVTVVTTVPQGITVRSISTLLL